MDHPLHRTQSRESAQSGKSTKSAVLLSNSYALSCASSGSTSSRKARSVDPETSSGTAERSDISSSGQLPQRPPVARALSDLNTKATSDTALLSSDPASVSSTAGGIVGGVTGEVVDADGTLILEGITLHYRNIYPIISAFPHASLPLARQSSKHGVRSRSKSTLLLFHLFLSSDNL